MISDTNATLLITTDLQRLLDERGIRAEDLHQVLSSAEPDKQFHTQMSTGHRLAYFTPSKVTYWVEYEPTAEGYRIYSAYSHRMKILHGFNLPSKKEQTFTGWHCTACGLPLEVATVKLAYLDETFAVDIPACPACQRVFVSEEQAVAKMALAERMLEDK
ncbi:MAG: DVU_1557 family redox protein [Desulfuromonadales bacterium]